MRRIAYRLLAGTWLALASGTPGAAASLIAVKPDLPAGADPVQGDWIRPADVMYIGDSESLGYFGDGLYRALSAEKDPKSNRPLRVWTYWTCGSDVPSWITGATSSCGVRSCDGAGDCARDHGPNDGPAQVRYAPLRRYLAEVRPRLTIVSLGTNMLTTRDFYRPAFYALYLQEVGMLAHQIVAAGSGCVWIGPPEPALATKPEKDYRRFAADMGRAAEAEGCRFIDSDPLSDRAFVLKRDPEGTHYQGAGEKSWAAKVWPRLEPLLKTALMK
jgi:hypothetical protein